MCADDRVPDGVALPQLDLDPLAQGREHLREDDLLVPHGSVRVFLHRRATLCWIELSKGFISALSGKFLSEQLNSYLEVQFSRISLLAVPPRFPLNFSQPRGNYRDFSRNFRKKIASVK